MFHGCLTESCSSSAVHSMDEEQEGRTCLDVAPNSRMFRHPTGNE